MEIVEVDLCCALCPLGGFLSQGHSAIHKKPLINAWGCNQGLHSFTGVSMTNSLYCVTWFNVHKSGRPSIRLTQHLHHCMTVGPVCNCRCYWCVFVCVCKGGYGCVDSVETVTFAPILADFHRLWECQRIAMGHISGILFYGDRHCYSQMSTMQFSVYRFCTICMNFSLLMCSEWGIWVKCIIYLH